MSEEQRPRQFPHYPSGIPVANQKDAGLMAKMISKGIKSKFNKSGGKKGIAANQTIHIGKRKTKFY